MRPGYPPIKLADYIVQKKAALQAREDKLKQIRQGLDPKVRGIKTHLTAVSRKFVIGSPMMFRLELINFRTTPVHYQNAGVDYHPLTLLNASREPVAAHEEPSQIMVRHGELAAGSSAILADKIDISQNHKITKLGKYYVQFSGRGLEIGEPLPPQEPGRFGEDPGLWPFSFIPALTQFPSEIVEIEVSDK